MKENFTNALTALLAPDREGGFSNDPRDPGGMTNRGVTRRVWSEWVGHDATEQEMRDLTIPAVTPLYKRKYWDRVNGDDLPSGLDFTVFDFAVNSGTGRAAKTLQGCLGVTVDGAIGQNTIAAAGAADHRVLIGAYGTARLKFLMSLPTWETYKNGWSRRVYEVTEEAQALAASA